MLEGIKEYFEKKKLERRENKLRINQLDKEGVPHCPKCHSTHLIVETRGFNAWRALVIGIFTLGIGLIAGFIGKNKKKCICLKCGYKFKIGK